jgi:hypothetical protein
LNCQPPLPSNGTSCTTLPSLPILPSNNSPGVGSGSRSGAFCAISSGVRTGKLATSSRLLPLVSTMNATLIFFSSGSGSTGIGRRSYGANSCGNCCSSSHSACRASLCAASNTIAINVALCCSRARVTAKKKVSYGCSPAFPRFCHLKYVRSPILQRMHADLMVERGTGPCGCEGAAKQCAQ